jgi:hypothetical protein
MEEKIGEWKKAEEDELQENMWWLVRDALKERHVPQYLIDRYLRAIENVEEENLEGRKLTFYRKDKIAAIIDGRKMLTIFFEVEKIIYETGSAVLLSKTGSAIGTLENVDKIEER